MLTNVLLSLLLSVNVPEGFQIDVFAKGLEGPRAILVLEDGTVLVTRPAMNDVLALRDRDGDGVADVMRTAIASVEGAQSLAMKGRTLYVAGANRVIAADRLPDGSFGEAHEVIRQLPAGGRRALALGGDGKLYVAVGSACAECVETHPEHATLLQFDADGLNRRIFARGLGDTAAIDAHPKTGELWSANGGELNRLGDGLHYGWPFCAGRKPASNAMSPEGMPKEKFCRSSEAAAFELPARASGFAFYRGAQFPEGFRGDAFAANGSKVLRVRFEDDKPVAAEEFASGANEIAGLAASAGVAAISVWFESPFPLRSGRSWPSSRTRGPTNVPAPARRLIQPSFSSGSSARRTVERLTFSDRTNSASVASRLPGAGRLTRM